MLLVAGTKLGPYEIVEPLGAGGMGEVYRARDTRLDRTVAIKILPPHLADDAKLRQRFEREAKTISRLNHPHICVLYDVGVKDGTHYLVMECVEGETLAKRLEKGPLPLEQVLKYGTEIADALDKAHRSGVMHRDLKPGNIMLTASGAKLLDFGLAKAAPALAAGATLTAAATRTTPVTQHGTVVGTFQYMSPEQVEGKELDGRSDIFSLGSVLYEMVTGLRAFPGKSQLSVASAILEKEPEAISKLQPMTPPALDHAVRRCLAKEPEKRWQSAADLAGELQWITEGGSQGGVPALAVSHRKVRERLSQAVAALGIALAIIAAVGWWRATRTAPERLPLRLSAELPAGLVIDRFAGAQLTISPDGTRVVVAERDTTGPLRLAMRSMDQREFAPLSGTDGARRTFFSPDGQWLAFFADGKLKKMPAQGGEPVTLCDAPGQFPRGASWGDDGNVVAAFNGGSTGLVRVPSGGGAPSQVTQPSKESGETEHGWPQVLPGSQAVLFTAYTGDDYDDAKIEVVSLKTGQRKTLRSGGFSGRYLPSGHLVYMRQNTLFAAPFDLSRLEVTGAPQPVLEEVSSNVSGGGDFDFSQTGTLVYVGIRGPTFGRQIAWLDGTGQTQSLHATPGHYENPRLSPDGKRLAFCVSSPTRGDIWIKDLERDTVSRLTHLPGSANLPLWTRDGKSIFFASAFQEAPGIYWIRADGVAEAQRLTNSKTPWPASFSPDGKRLAYVELNADNHLAIWTAPVERDRDHPRLGKPELFSHTSFSESYPAFSPDGHWLAYSSNESGSSELYVQPFPGPGGKSQVSSGGGSRPIWARDGHKLFFLSPDGHIIVADYFASGDSFHAGKPRVWSQRTLAFLGGNYPYDLAPDGKRFAVVLHPAETSEQVQKPIDSVTVLLNFFDELRRKVPTHRN